MALFFCAPSDGDIGDQKGKPKGQHQRKIDNQKQTASVLSRKIRKSPQISHAYRAAGSGKNKSDLP